MNSPTFKKLIIIAGLGLSAAAAIPTPQASAQEIVVRTGRSHYERREARERAREREIARERWIARQEARREARERYWRHQHRRQHHHDDVIIVP